MYKLILILIFSASTLMAQYDFERRIYLENELEQTFDSLRFGLNENATYGIDLELGEKEYPNLGFPAGVFHGFFFLEIDGAFAAVYRDYRPIADEDEFMVEHTIKTYKGLGETIFLSWENLPEFVDSAVIVDKAGFNMINMLDSTHGTIFDAWARDIVKMKIWYNKNLSSIKNIEHSIVTIFPNPSSNYVQVNSNLLFSEYKIYDLLGNIQSKGKIIDENQKIYVDMLNKGIYVLVLYNKKMSKSIKIIKN